MTEHTHRLRVRYCETDRMGVAHHGSYVDWFEEARTEWMRARGKSYRELEDEGVLLAVVDVHVSYRRSVTYDDALAITTRLKDLRRVTITLEYEVRREDDGELVAVGTTTLACTGRDGRPRRLPAGI